MEEGDRIMVLSEGCISHILSFTSPRDVCASSLLSTTFKSAADCDAVWEKFLPHDYKDIAALRAVPALDLTGFGSKKELYFRLCDEPLLVDGGNKSLSLEKKSGKKCFMIGARELIIHWGDTSRYWKWIPLDSSRFAEGAQLLFVCWLYITGTIHTQTLSPKTKYGVYLVIKFTDNAYGLHHPASVVSVDFVNGEGSGSGTRLVFLDPKFHQRRLTEQQRQIMGHTVRASTKRSRPSPRGDGWMELEMGEFYNDVGEGAVTMTLSETKTLNAKGGLVVQGIEVRPKEN